MLRAAGLDDIEEQVYRAALRRPAAPVAELARSVGASSTRVRGALVALEELGLVERTTHRRFVPADPESALLALIQRREAELTAARGEVVELADEYRTGRVQSETSDLVEVLTSPETIARRLRELNHGVHEEILVFDKPPYLFQPGDEVAVEQPLLRRGVVAKAIYSQEAFAWPRRVENLQRLAALGEESRVLPELPFKLRIYDRRAGVVPLMSNDQSVEGVAVIHRSGILLALVALFEAYWERAFPVAGGATARPAELTDKDVEVLRLLGTGLKDEAIARQLGISMRTVRRRVLRMMDLLHASTRFQAGAQAMRRGWL